MANSGGSAEDANSLELRHAQRLRQAVADLDDWPRSWHVDPADIPVGKQIESVAGKTSDWPNVGRLCAA